MFENYAPSVELMIHQRQDAVSRHSRLIQQAVLGIADAVAFFGRGDQKGRMFQAVLEIIDIQGEIQRLCRAISAWSAGIDCGTAI